MPELKYIKSKDIYVDRNEQRKNKRRKFVWQYKLDHPTCVDCNVDYPPPVLDFDHLRDKVANISEMVKTATPMEVLLKEIAKCEIVCSNCHRMRTYNRSKVL